MSRLLSVAGGCALALAMLFAVAPKAGADTCEVDASGICLEHTEPGTPPGGTPDPATPADPATEAGGCHDQAGTKVPCADGYGGSWSGPPRWCYQYQLDPQPPADSPLWGSHDPVDGSLWSCDYGLTVPANTFFLPDEQTVVDAGTIARDLVSRAPFEYADAATAPGGDAPTYVGYETWLWVAGRQWRPVAASLTAAGATVTIEGTPTTVEWEIGENHQSCAGPGREWKSGLNESATTPCSIAINGLQDPEGDLLKVTARIEYAVTWTCTGRCSEPSGDLGTVAALPGRAAELNVRQRQTVVTS